MLPELRNGAKKQKLPPLATAAKAAAAHSQEKKGKTEPKSKRGIKTSFSAAKLK